MENNNVEQGELFKFFKEKSEGVGFTFDQLYEKCTSYVDHFEFSRELNRNRHFFELTLSTLGDVHEIKARRHIADMAPIFDGETVVGRWRRIDHAYETIRSLCRSLGCTSFKVQV